MSWACFLKSATLRTRSRSPTAWSSWCGGQADNSSPRRHFSLPATSGWSVELRLPDEALVIRFPDTSYLYDGSLPSGPTWQRAVAVTGDVVITTGSMADVDCIDPAIQAGLTTYLRVPLSIER